MSEKFKFATLDTGVLEYWLSFNLSNKLKQQNDGKPKFIFCDGPPFTSSESLHLGHLLVSYVKSCVLNYKHMKGFNVENILGYDCHGLPIEMVANAKLGIQSKDDICKLGIDKYNQVCKDLIAQFSGSWTGIYNRIGRFINYDDSYKTMDTNFMESVWFVFASLYAKGLIYQSYQIMPFSTACGTSLSNFEVSQNYKDTEDMSVYVAINLSNRDEKIIIWTTTPWTLPSNLALCINPDLIYTTVKHGDNTYIVAKDCLYNVFPKKKDAPDSFTIVKEFPGKELIGLEYIPAFNYYNREYRILGDSFVEATSGSGIVHIAPAFGEIDFDVCLKNNILTKDQVGQYCPITDEGTFTDPVTDYKGMHYLEVNKLVVERLKQSGSLIRKQMYKHSYPFCWRTDTPLIYKPISSFFVNTQLLKVSLLNHNNSINWFPKFVGDKRMHHWLENVKDWGITRSRFFGTPIPIWVSDDGEEIVCVGSIDELVKLANLTERPTDLHREFMDAILIPSQRGKGMLKRIGDVFDCWFESGAVPVAEHHYPFKNHVIESADFICEGIDQVRGWMYTLLVESTALFDRTPFKNCICTGLILDENGKKISKRLGNFIHPIELLDTHGSDALRLYLIGSPAVKADSVKFSTSDVEIISGKLFQLFNCYKFTLECLTKFIKDGHGFNMEAYMMSTNVMDKWILSKIGTLCSKITQYMDGYKVYKVPRLILDFIEQWSNWYIKFNRNRFKGKYCDISEQHIALSTLVKSLYEFCKMCAPFLPFLTEYMHLNLKMQIFPSIHMYPYPVPMNVDTTIEHKMEQLQKVACAVRSIRSKTSTLTSVKVPIKRITLLSESQQDLNNIVELERYLNEEINSLEIIYKQGAANIKYKIIPNNKLLGQKYRNLASKIKDALSKINSYEGGNIMLQIDGVEYIILPEEFTVDTTLDTVVGPMEKFEYTDGFLVIVDTNQDDQVRELHTIRLVLGEIQNMKKSTQLKPWDAVNIYCETDNDTQTLLKRYADKISIELACDIVLSRVPNSDIIIEKSVVLNARTFKLTITK